MKIIQFLHLCLIQIVLHRVNAHVTAFGNREVAKKTRCLNPPRTARRVENFIHECQDEVKNKLIQEAFQILKEEVSKDHPSFSEYDDTEQYIEETAHAHNTQSTEHHSYASPGQSGQQQQYHDAYIEQSNNHYDGDRIMSRLMHRIRRVGDLSSGVYHPTLVPFEDKRLAGCLLHCVYAKSNAIDKYGWPTLDGLVHFYSEGVHEHGFFMATLRSVNLCLRAVTAKYHVNRHKLPERGESCDLAFDVFDCISDQITGYCLDHYKEDV